MGNLRNYIIKEHVVYDDETRPTTSPYDIVWPVTVLDAVIDQNTPERKTLRQILDDMLRRLDEGPDDLQIDFPVRSVRGADRSGEHLSEILLGDVVLQPQHLGLGEVDNTSDMTKPVSEPQIDYIQKQLKIWFDKHHEVLLDNFTSHINNFSNPHRVTLSQLDHDGDVTNCINDAIMNALAAHDTSPASHYDIRRRINTINDELNGRIDDTNETVRNLDNRFITHSTIGGIDHTDFFDAKENRVNKAEVFTSPYVNYPGQIQPTLMDSVHYPTTEAVAEYIEARLKFPAEIQPEEIGVDFIRNIDVRENDNNMPTPNANRLGQAFLVKRLTGIPGWAGLSVCRYEGGTYTWDTKAYTQNIEFDPADFVLGVNGWKLRPINMRHDFLTDVFIHMPIITGPDGEEYFKMELTVIGDHIVPNGERTTEIFRFGKLAQKNKVYRDDIVDREVLNRHLADNSVATRNIINANVTTAKIADRNVTSLKIAERAMQENHFPARPTSVNWTGGSVPAPNPDTNGMLENFDAWDVRDGNYTSWVVNGYNIFHSAIRANHIQDRQVANRKLANMSSQRVKGRRSSGVGIVEDITMEQLADMLRPYLSAFIASPSRPTGPNTGKLLWIDTNNGRILKYNTLYNTVGADGANGEWLCVRTTY